MQNTISQEIYIMLNEVKKLSTTYPEKSYAIGKEAYYMSKNNNLKVEEGYALVGMSLACRAKSEIVKMMDHSYNALEIFEAVKIPLGQIKSLNLIGIAYYYSSMYEESLEYLLKAMDLLGEFNDSSLLSCVLNNIGEVFRESTKYDKALEYYFGALKICEDNNFKMNSASIFSNVGEIYFIENNYDKALEYYTKSYDILIEENDMVILGEVENRLGKIHYIKKNYIKAEEYFFIALRRLNDLNNKFYSIDVLTNIAKLYFEKDSDKSFYYFEKAIRFAEKINSKKKLSEVCQTAAEYYEKTGNYRVALEYFKKYNRINEEIMSLNVGNKFEILKVEFKHIKEHDRLEEIKIVNKRLETEILNQKNELDRIKESNEILEKKAFQDELTGIPNRRYINNYLNETWKKSLLYNGTISLFIIDVDNFKKYNDYWGHSKGDECLVKIANCLKQIQVKRKDVFGRYGGEEFIYYAKGINYDQTLELGNLMRKEVEKQCLKYKVDNENTIVTISVGGALGRPTHFGNVSNMMQIADKQLYKAKNMGRNIAFLKNLLE